MRSAAAGSVRAMINKAQRLTVATVEAEYGLTRRHQQRLRSERRLTYAVIGNRVLYKRSDVEKLMADNTIEAEP